MQYIQSAEFRNVLLQRAGFRGALHTECRVQKYATYRVQECAVYIVQHSEVHNIQRVGFRSVLRTEGRVHECALRICRAQGS